MRPRRRGRRKKKDLIDRLETNLAAAVAAQAASAPTDPALSASWRPLTPSRIGAGDRGAAAAPSATPRGAETDETEGYADDDEGPRWPDENEEESALAERAVAEPATIREHIEQAAAIEQAEQAESVRDLPPLDDLVERIPPTVREGLEDLFRARFTKVRRLPRRVFSRPTEES